jgi:NAD-dependent SIR2 family protein deacetylase
VAQTTGLVQKLTVGEIFSCAWIGPTPNNTELLLLQNDGSPASVAFYTTAIDTLSAALTNYRAVVAIHGDSDATVTGLRIDPV